MQKHAMKILQKKTIMSAREMAISIQCKKQQVLQEELKQQKNREMFKKDCATKIIVIAQARSDQNGAFIISIHEIEEWLCCLYEERKWKCLPISSIPFNEYETFAREIYDFISQTLMEQGFIILHQTSKYLWWGIPEQLVKEVSMEVSMEITKESTKEPISESMSKSISSSLSGIQ